MANVIDTRSTVSRAVNEVYVIILAKVYEILVHDRKHQYRRVMQVTALTSGNICGKSADQS